MTSELDEYLERMGVENIAVLLREVIGPEFAAECERLGIDTEALISCAPLSARFREERTRKNLTIKDVSARLRVPQYRLRAIEERRFREMDAAVFRKYCRFLNLNGYVDSCTQQNPELARKLGIAPQDKRT